MAKMQFTDDQNSAIVTKNIPVIVSAAAGSGKTAVLVERVMRTIIEDGINVSDLIVVTFTEAAASEMRSKITNAILERLEEEPQNTRLRRQLTLMPQAKIQTVHSFCSSLIKENFHRCGVSYDFSLIDEAEKNILLEECLSDILEERYGSFAKNDEFRAFFNNFSDDRGDRQMRELVLELYERLRSDRSPSKWLQDTIDETYDNELEGIENTVWGAFLISESKTMHDYALKRLKSAYNELTEEPAVMAKYGAAFESLIAYGENLTLAMGKKWDDIYEALKDIPDVKLGACRFDDKEFLEKMKSARSFYIDSIKKIKEGYISADSKTAVKENNITAPIIRELCRLTMELEKEFSIKKRERNVLDYSDLEHMALSLLYDEEKDEISDIAKRISKETYELLVDEFQDTNEIQDTIFKCIEPATKNVFYVGDVKQSIYKFRLADPTIFIEKYKEAKPIDFEGEKKRVKIDLNKNFRSSTGVLSAANFVFEQIMTEEFGGVDYDETQKLYLGAQYNTDFNSEMCIIDLFLKDDDSEEKKAIEAEAKYIASKISELCGTMEIEENGVTRPAKYSDFAILLSSYSNKIGYFQYELARSGIPCAVSKKENFTKRSEIMAVMSLLKVIDNPYQDIPLVAVMRSYMYGFTADEVAQTRIGNKDGYLYEGLLKMRDTDEKAKNLLDSLERYRHMAKNMKVSRLIENIYDEHKLNRFFAGMEEGEARRENLALLINIAENYEKNGYKGLFRFISYFENKYSSESEERAFKAEGVNIMSIHKSKGLEYPVVFLPDLAKRFNTQDLNRSVLFHDKLKIGIKYRDNDSMTVYKSQLYNALSIKSRKELTEEEMRKLYVAMTRAKQKLILVMSLQNASKKIKEWAEDSWEKASPSAVANAGSFAQWLIYAYIHHSNADILRGYTGLSMPHIAKSAHAMDFSVISPNDIPMPEKSKSVFERSDSEVTAELPEWYNKPYEHESLTVLPSKLSPTMLRELKGEQPSYKPAVKDSSDKTGGIEKGNALHHIMENMDFERWKNRESAESLVNEIMESRLMEDEEKELVDVPAIMSFFESEIGDIIKSAYQIKKEQQFAALFTPKELRLSDDSSDSVVMNGIIDLLLFTKDGMVIVDYKSDKVWSTAEKMANVHREQVEIYAKAAEKIFKMPVIGKYIFLFDAKTAVKL